VADRWPTETRPRKNDTCSSTCHRHQGVEELSRYRSAVFVALWAEQAAQASIKQPAQRRVQAGGSRFESTANAFEQLWRSGFDMSHFAERSSSKVARGGRFRLLIDEGLGQFGQSLIGVLLFRQGGIQKLDGLVHPKLARPGAVGSALDPLAMARPIPSL
jgi:hypothetical protein